MNRSHCLLPVQCFEVMMYVGLSIIEFADQKMGGSQSVEVPGGGTEGYHVLRVQVQRLVVLEYYMD